MLDIHPADKEKLVTGSEEVVSTPNKARNRRAAYLLGGLGFVSFFVLLDRFHYKDLRAKERATMQATINASNDSLQEKVQSIGLDENYTVTITDEVDWAGDPDAEIEVAFGNCRAEIPMRETSRAYVTDGTLPYAWDRAEEGGEDNLLAIPDEFGNVLGYLTLTAEHIEASFPAECAE